MELVPVAARPLTLKRVPTTVDLLTPKQEAFCRSYIEGGNAAKAYRQAFDVSPDASSQTIRQRAYELVHSPAVADRIRTLKAAAAEATVVSVRARMVHLQMIVDADPTELIRTVRECCRHCYSVGHHYEWRSEIEFALALDAHLASIGSPKPLPLPDAAGGFEYRPDRAPNAACPVCSGNGELRTIVTPSDELSPSARALLKGVRHRANGEIEIMTHCKLTASDQLNRMQSAYVERSVSINANVNVPALKNMSHDEALDFLESLRPTQ